jgi:glycerol-3-phosphate dehydrogenase
VTEALLGRYGADALEIQAGAKIGTQGDGPPGFPALKEQLRHGIRHEMVMHLDDFFLRRVPLYSARADHGMPWAETLGIVWESERGLGAGSAQVEVGRLAAAFQALSAWRERS